MRRFALLALAWVVLVSTLYVPAGRAVVTEPAQAAQRSPQAWTLDEALAELALYPGDAYLQYVALQLARRAGRFKEVYERLQWTNPDVARAIRTARRNSVDLFSIFTGAQAVQESLQLDTMRAATDGRATRPEQTPSADGSLRVATVSPRARRPLQGTGRRRRRARRIPIAPPVAVPVSEQVTRRRPDEVVPIASLKGPTVKSHPWEQMLAGRKPAISQLARYVPEDFYLVEFRSLSRMMEVMDTSDLWGTHLFNQAFAEARTQGAAERLKRQLAMKTETALRPFYDMVVEDVAVTGSDPFVREGSDVTVIFRVKQPLIFKARMDAFLDEAQKARADATRTVGSYLGVDYVQLQTPERDVSVISADPEPGLHVRSNSLAAFRRVLEAIKGKTAEGRDVRRLGDTAEFAYIRTLMPQGDKEEDGLVYMSDPFVRRLVGPELKLTERRRILCYNHLRMIGHAALLYRTEFGKWPASLEELARANAAPGTFGKGELSCPDGGHYSLSPEGAAGYCSRHGHALYLTPNIEIPVAEVTGEEADEYDAFLADYSQYWRMYFDPIALRLKATPQQYRVETLILPLIDNSIYTGLASALSGPPEPLDTLPVPGRNIFTLGMRLDKKMLSKELLGEGAGAKSGPRREEDSWDKMVADLKAGELLSQGLGNQVGLNIYDNYPNFDLNMSNLLGMIIQSGGAGRGSPIGSEMLMIGTVLMSLNAPVYLSFPVQDERVVDGFLGRLDSLLAKSTRGRSMPDDWFALRTDYYKFTLKGGQEARAVGFRFGPAKLRLFIARVGKGLYVASKPFVLEDLAATGRALEGQAKTGADDAESVGHAMARVRARNWSEVLPDFNLSWAENERDACLNNLMPLESIARALTAKTPGQSTGGLNGADMDRALLDYADKLYAVRFFCPEGGSYVVSPDGKAVSCTVHGTALAPRQPATPSGTSAAGRAMRGISDMTATLTFLPEGLRAVVVVNRK